MGVIFAGSISGGVAPTKKNRPVIRRRKHKESSKPVIFSTCCTLSALTTDCSVDSTPVLNAGLGRLGYFADPR